MERCSCHLLGWESLGGGGLGKCSQELNFGHAKFEKTIRNVRFANLYKYFLYIYHESVGFLKLDYISCMLLKLHKLYKKEKIKAKIIVLTKVKNWML